MTLLEDAYPASCSGAEGYTVEFLRAKVDKAYELLTVDLLKPAVAVAGMPAVGTVDGMSVRYQLLAYFCKGYITLTT